MISTRHRGSRYKGYQCTECRYVVLSNSADANRHLREQHGLPGWVPRERPVAPLAVRLWVAGAAVVAGLLLALVACALQRM